jgi:hypothetical protein
MSHTCSNEYVRIYEAIGDQQQVERLLIFINTLVAKLYHKE